MLNLNPSFVKLKEKKKMEQGKQYRIFRRSNPKKPTHLGAKNGVVAFFGLIAGLIIFGVGEAIGITGEFLSGQNFFISLFLAGTLLLDGIMGKDRFG